MVSFNFDEILLVRFFNVFELVFMVFSLFVR